VPDVTSDGSRNGRIITFYSYAGGTGRTSALANIAWILASNGNRVLATDWDLESPGLHRFFAPFLELSLRDAPGVIDLIRDYEWVAANSAEGERRQTHIPNHARIQKYVIPLKGWTFPGGGSLEFLSSGKQNRDYLATLSALDWDNFYAALNGGDFIEAIRAEMKRHYDYTLIDSRTGFSDVADICTVELPDVLIDCFTLSTQGVDGAERVARHIAELYGYRAIRVLPVPMRVDESEKEKLEASRVFAERKFENLPAGMVDAQRRAYWNNVQVPYRAYYAYEEVLAVFGDAPGQPGSILSAYERLTGYITDGAVTGMPSMDEDLRTATRARFDRKPPLESKQVSIEFLAAGRRARRPGPHRLRRSAQLLRRDRACQLHPGQQPGQHLHRVEVRRPGLHLHLRARDAPGHPPRMRDRGEHVILAVPQQDRDLDVLQREPPGLAKGQHVIDPAVRPVLHRFLVGPYELAVYRHIGDDPPVRVAHLRLERDQQALGVLADLIGALGQVGRQDLLSQDQRDAVVTVAGAHFVFIDIRLRHAVEPVEVLGVRRGEPDQDGDAAQAIGADQGGAGERVRPAAGAAHHAELRKPQRVSDREHVTGRIGDRPSPGPAGIPVAWPVIADQLDAEPVQDTAPRDRPVAAARGSVQQEYRESFRVAPAVKTDAAPIGNLDYLRQSSLPEPAWLYQGTFLH
jgi:MinD-like ATPase involved in chromosome partitioning or flagellar assembly